MPTAVPAALAPLDVLTGAWRSRGRTVAAPGAPAVEIEGTDVYEWLPGGGFMVHTVDVRVGGEPVRVLELIGDFDGGSYAMRAFDHAGTFSEMRATVDGTGRRWTFADDTTRAFLDVDPAGTTMSARWERLTDDGWTHWMDMSFTRER
jgi:hypothetical protein